MPQLDPRTHRRHANGGSLRLPKNFLPRLRLPNYPHLVLLCLVGRVSLWSVLSCSPPSRSHGTTFPSGIVEGLRTSFMLPQVGSTSRVHEHRHPVARPAFTGARPPGHCGGSQRRTRQTMLHAGSVAKALGWGAVAFAVLRILYLRVKNWFETPKRPYNDDSVADSYDTWTREGVLEHYWGEHIHMGSYTPMSEQKGFRKNDSFPAALFRASLLPLKDFKAAKVDFTKEMIAFSGAVSPRKILDVGCGIGGSSRILAQQFPDAEVIGISLSPEQVARANSVTQDAGISNARFEVMNALDMAYPTGTFDMVWACESGEHMPDKKKYVEEMVRVLAPQGKLVVATWCERDPIPPFTNKERKTLDFLYAEWSHPFFISLSKYQKYLQGTGSLASVETADWTEQTLPSWRHSIWVGVWRPLFWMKIVARQPSSFLNFLREVYTLERYHRSMRRGLMIYGMMRATKQPAGEPTKA